MQLDAKTQPYAKDSVVQYVCLRYWYVHHTVMYTVSGKKRPPKHVKIILWIENVSEYFSLYHENLSICNVSVKFHDK